MTQFTSSLLFVLIAMIPFTRALPGQVTKSNGFLIKGTIKGIDSGTIRIVSRQGNCVSDSSAISNGRFTIRGKVDVAERVVFNVSPGNWNFKAFVEDTILSLFVDTTDAQHYDNGREQWALIGNVEQTGSELANTYTEYTKETRLPFYIHYITSLREKLSSIKGDKNAEAKVIREIDSASNRVFASQRAWIEHFIIQHPSSIAGVYMFLEYYQLSNRVSLSYLDSTLNRFSGVAATSGYYKELTSIAGKLKSIEPKQLAPDFKLQKRDKSEFTLSTLRGRYILIDFWASWCVPCRKAIPDWKAVYAKYKNKGFMIVSVSNDRIFGNWIRALNKEQMPWLQVIDHFPDQSHPALVSNLYGIKSMPFYVLLDKEGKTILASAEEKLVKDELEKIFP